MKPSAELINEQVNLLSLSPSLSLFFLSFFLCFCLPLLSYLPLVFTFFFGLNYCLLKLEITALKQT